MLLMARPLRIEYAGAYYHVMNRGNRRQTVFAEPKDYELFLGTEAFRDRVRRAYLLTRSADRREQPVFERARRSISFGNTGGNTGDSHLLLVAFQTLLWSLRNAGRAGRWICGRGTLPTWVENPPYNFGAQAVTVAVVGSLQGDSREAPARCAGRIKKGRLSVVSSR
jgi:hypothetical protein